MKLKWVVLVVSVAVVALAIQFGTGTASREEGREEIYVPAAVSLGNAMERLARDFEDSYGIRVQLDLASSGLLRKRIEAGAPADAFVSASTRDVDLLENSGYLVSETRRDLLGNTLVCVVEASSTLRIVRPADLLKDEVRWIAIGDPTHVPAGIYAKQALVHMGLWKRLAGKLVPCIDARAAMAQVRTGAVEAAIVYSSDVHAASELKMVFGFPQSSHEAIVYAVCVLKGAAHPVAAGAFLEFLCSPEAAGVFAIYGFKPVHEEGRR